MSRTLVCAEVGQLPKLVLVNLECHANKRLRWISRVHWNLGLLLVRNIKCDTFYLKDYKMHSNNGEKIGPHNVIKITTLSEALLYHLIRAGQVVNNSIQQQLYPRVLEGRANQHLQ